ncbi:Aste57867_384 [Aphanomyces stellatus]|uniref:Aste57867_384 protein n=1 Tax=Aphanomyces stellatus TaxID=120398 RepID=A0A485K2N5_9STRA|nr:hypothetical protein As57867_000383 [Aphanomyces stellatus]VFT77609.1 Aste57867_384 [Aphanomyces stellatus]
MWQTFAVLAVMVFVAMLVVVALRRFPLPADATMAPEPSSFLITFRAALLLLYCVSLAGFTGLPTSWVMYTVWNFTLQAIYYGWAIAYQWRHRHSRASQCMTKEGRILSMFFDVCFSVSFLVCLVFWTVVLPSNPAIDLNWNTCLQHAGNVVFLVVEFAFNGRSVRASSLGYVLLLPLVYGILSWIGHETWRKGFWPYQFLDVSAPLSPAWYLGVCLVHSVFLFGAIGLTKLKWRVRPVSVVDAVEDVHTPKDNYV